MANISGLTYAQMKHIANAMGIHATDQSLWSDTQYIRRLLSARGFVTFDNEIPFESWDGLPDLALLSIKHYQENEGNFWQG
ncbi:hypothetical protein [Pusillimonas sp. NJUB218]|uniref:hypothetical protein n=1 Tax=Pusillimonas sp. NJUB218 TaxID=2023230 RepID=UPI0018F2DAEB|nr:hypothetical protein [Pusillimonas sp. NJUB218]